MTRGIRHASVLTFILAALFSQVTPVSAQGTGTGTARGEVKLVTLVNGQRQEGTRRGVRVFVVSAKAIEDPEFKFELCNASKYAANCKLYRTIQGGLFTTQPLTAALTWYFFPRHEGFRLEGATPAYELVEDKMKNISPPALRLGQVAGRAAPGRGDSAGSRGTRRGANPFITLTLYRTGGQGSAAAGEEKLTLAGKVVDTQHNALGGADVFVRDFGDPGSKTGPAVLPKAVTNPDGRFTLELPGRLGGGIYLFVALEGFRPFVAPLSQELINRLGRGQGAGSAVVLPAVNGQGGEDKDAIVLARREELQERSEPMLETIEATRRHVFRPEVMQALPVSGTRSFDEFALLAPGVLPPPETFGGVGPGLSAGVGTAGQFSVNGMRSRENNFTIDGSDNNDEDIGTRRQGFIMTVPQPVESVQELQVITALADARFGRNIGGQVNVLTKTGGEGKAHGTLYSYVTDQRLNARSLLDRPAANTPPAFALRRQDGAPVLLDGAAVIRPNRRGGEEQSTHLQLGMAVGGELPGHKDSSYFISAERQDMRAGRESHFAVPTVRQRGAFDSGDTGLLLADPNGRTPLYPASIPGDAVFSLFPFPNNPNGPYGENTYSTILPADGRGTRFSVKLGREYGGDPPPGEWWRNIFTLKPHIDQVTGRYNFTDELSTLPVTGGALFSSLRPKVRTQNLSGYINRSLSPTTSDTIRLSFGRTRLSFDERRDAALSASSALPSTQFLLNAPLLLNVTRPNADGTLNAPTYLSASGAQGAALLASLGYQGVTQTEQITGPLGQVFVAGFSPIGVDVENFPQERANNTWQVADTITSVRGDHVFTMGVDMRKTRINSSLDRNFRPRAVFNGLPGAPFAAAVERPGAGQVQSGVVSGATLAAAGVPTGFFQALASLPDSSIGIHFTQANFFFQDQWRKGPNLHLTFGMRYELNTVPDTVGHRLERAFDPGEVHALAQQAAQSCQPAGRCADLVDALTSAFLADFTVSFGSDRNDFDGRIGFAWTPERLHNTSIRGGFATYSGQFPGIVIDHARNAFPDFLPLNLANFSARAGNRTFLFNLASPAVQQLLPAPGGVAPGTLNRLAGANPVSFLVNQNLSNLSLKPTVFGLDLVLPQPKLKTPSAFHYSLTVERQFRGDYLASLAYVGTRGERLLRMATSDRGLNNSGFASPVAVSPLDPQRPFPHFAGQLSPAQTRVISQSFAVARTFFGSTANSTYNSLQAELRKRYSKSFLLGSAFTYSHSIDNASDFFDNAGAFNLPQNSLRRDERASSNFDVRLRSATHFVLDFKKDWFRVFGNWGSRALGAMQLSGVFTAQTGQPYTVNSAIDINRDGNLTDRLDTTTGVLRVGGRGPVQLRLAPGLNPRDLLAAEGRDGSVGRNTFRAPNLYSFDFAVTETLPSFGDQRRFIIRAEFFNLFNWANYGIPVRILESPGFGNSVRTLIQPRSIQIVGKFQF